jgi:hypothetical protein
VTTWFSAKLLFRSNVADGQTRDALREESTIVVRATSIEEATSKARAFGAGAQHDYLNEDGAVVSWSFVDVLEVQDLCEHTLADGTEVWSRIFRE